MIPANLPANRPAGHRGGPGPVLRWPGRRGVAAVAAALCLLGLAGCAGVPTSSAPRVVESVPKGGIKNEPEIRYQITPQPGETAAAVVRDFIAASGSPERQHSVARRYLAPQAVRDWNDSAGAVVLARQPYLEEGNGGREITIRADQVGRVDFMGSFLPESQPYSYRFELQQVDDEWRISNPPGGVVVPAAQFQQAYRRLNVYFLDQAENRVVPDPRWFSAPRDSLPNLLLRTLLQGPAASLQAAVKTDLGPLSLASNVVPDDDRVRLYLSGLDRIGARARAAASAQIVWTLNQLGVPGVQIFNEGQPLKLPGVGDVQHLSDWRSYDPDDLPLAASGYFVRRGAVWSTDGHPVPGPAGLGSYQARSVGVSRDLGKLAVVGPVRGGLALFVGPARGPLARRVGGASFTAPTWGGDLDEVWTVRNGTDILQVPDQGAPNLVGGEDLDRIGPVSVLRLARDGSRVALVAGPQGGQRLYVGAVNRTGGAALGQLTAIAPDLRNVVDVGWSAADMLMVLTRSGASDAALHSVAVDGSVAQTVTTAGLPGPPSTLAAAPTMPMLTVAENGIWRLRDPQGSWTSVQRGGNLPDSAPAYPG
jgi:hypothetical protein